MKRKGMIEVISGPMFSGKSSELIRRLTIQQIARKHIVIFKHKSDDRFGKPEDITSRNGTRFTSIPVHTVGEMHQYIDVGTTEVVGIDEVQFFDKTALSRMCQILADKHGISVIVCGLDMDFQGVPFETTATLMAMADSVFKSSAVCNECRHTDAIYTHRLHGGNERVQIGSDSYEPRCRACRV